MGAAPVRVQKKRLDTSVVVWHRRAPTRRFPCVPNTFAEGIALLAEGKVDAYLATPPFGQELRAKQIGNVIVED